MGKPLLQLFLLWVIGTVGYVFLQEKVPGMIGTVVGLIYNTSLGFAILNSSWLDMLFSAAVWCIYGGLLLGFLTLLFIAFFYTLLNFYSISDKIFDFTDMRRTLCRVSPWVILGALLILGAAALVGVLNWIMPSPFTANWATNFLFSSFLVFVAFFTTADVISNSILDAALNTARLVREYWKTFLFFVLSCTVLASLLGTLLFSKGSDSLAFQLLLSGTGFFIYGVLAGFLFDFFIRHKDPFLLKQRENQ